MAIQPGDNQWRDHQIWILTGLLSELVQMHVSHKLGRTFMFQSRSADGLKLIRRSIDRTGQTLLDTNPVFSWRTADVWDSQP